MRPALVMSAGMMPALDCPGEITPGQLGPMSRLANRIEDRYAAPLEFNDLPTLTWGHTADDFGTGVHHALSVLTPLGAGHALDDDLRVRVEKNSHDRPALSARR